jgi:hypothetical protein
MKALGMSLPHLTGLWDRPWGEATALDDERAPALRIDPRIEQLARILCVADSNIGPDTLVTEQQLPHGPKGSLVLPDREIKAWQLYTREAYAALKAFDAGELNKG